MEISAKNDLFLLRLLSLLGGPYKEVLSEFSVIYGIADLVVLA